MAKHETLGSLFTDIADQLREKGHADIFSCVSMNAPFSVRDVCYGGGKFVAVGDNLAAYSTDGINWTEVTLPESVYVYSVCYGDGRFVAVGHGLDGNGAAAYSDDGINWTRGLMAPGYFIGVCYGNGTFVAFGANLLAVSEDGNAWAAVGLGSGSFHGASVCYGNGKFVAVGHMYWGGTGGLRIEGYAYYSENGINWTETVIAAEPWRDVCYGNGKFVAVGAGAAAYSTDGMNWVEANVPSVGGFAVCYGNNRFIAVGGNWHIVHSEDGATWTMDNAEISTTAGSPIYIAFGEDRFVFGGNGGFGYGKAGLIADSFPDVIAELSPLNIAYGATPPSDTAKLWVPLEAKPASVEVSLDSLLSAVDELTTKSAALSVAVGYPAAAEVGGKIYIFGGTPTSGATLIQEYDPAADTIATKTAVLPLNLYGAAAVAINEKIYIFGGVSYKTSIYEYDPATDTLTQKESVLADGVSYPAAVAIGGKAYIFGGQTAASTYTTLIQEYDPATDTCVKMSAVLESTNYGAAAVAINGKAYIFGGRSYSTAIQEYDPATDTIITKDCVLLDGVLNATAAAINGKAYIFGGQTGASVYTDWIQEYDPLLDAIVQKSAVLPEPVGRAAMVEVGGKAYLIGGYADGSYVSTILEYTARESLAENHLKIFATGAAGESGQVVRLVNWPGSSLKMQVFSTYLGDADGYAAAQEAYIYDTEAAAWKSLSGSVYTG